MASDRTTNELEFQGNVLSWINAELGRRPALGLELATQESSKVDRRRNDLVIWKHRVSNNAFFTLELKTPETAITDPALLLDACQKAQRWKAPFFAIWNMQSAELYRTPDGNQRATPNDRIKQFPPLSSITSVSDWINEEVREKLRVLALALLDAAWAAATQQGVYFPIDASIFVDRLTRRIHELRDEVQPVLAKQASANKSVQKRLRHIAAAQGFLEFVDDLNAAIAGQFCYRIVGQILFYFALRRKQPSLPTLNPKKADPFIKAVRPFWDDVRRFDYEALFEPHELDKIVPLTEYAEKSLHGLINDFNEYDWNTLKDDVLGSIFEQLIPKREQILLGQFYTPSAVADLLLVFALDGEEPKLLDPGCGSGTFLLRGYQYLRDTRHLKHSQLLPLLWGFDISPFATELAVINLFRQDLAEFENFPRILSGDFFQRSVGDLVEFPPARKGAQDKVRLSIPKFDAIVANPPYLRSQHQDDLDPDYKKKLYSTVGLENGTEFPAKTDSFAFFVYHAYQFLRPGGRLAFVTSASWLTTDYGYSLQRFLIEKLRLIAIIGSEVESFFTQVDQNTVLFVAEKREVNSRPAKDEIIRFVTLKQRLDDLVTDESRRWMEMQKLVDRIEEVRENHENEIMRIRCVSVMDEYKSLIERSESRNWSLPLRAPTVYFKLTDSNKENFVTLDEIADCHLGYKSLQNQFFYLNKDSIANYHIEKEFLKPIYQMADLDSDKFLQTAKPETHLFICNKPQSDIRGTGAFRYIRRMEDQTAAVKKQSRQSSTISDVLAKQGGSLWYAPKATPHEAHIGVRKAFDGTYAPVIFKQARVLDQRCNCLIARSGLAWETVAAIITSSIFALSVEAAGAASMGAGALEMPTTKLRKILVPNLHRLSTDKRNKLIKLAKAVWENDQPFNWKNSSSKPSQHLQKLDKFVLTEFGSGVSPENIYDGIRQALLVRFTLAKEKAKAQKVAESINISSLARAIIESFKHELESKRFPESFMPPNIDTLPIEIDPKIKFEVLVEPFMSESQIRIITSDSEPLFTATLKRPVAEVLLRSLMLGRRHFLIPKDQDVADKVLKDFWAWFHPLFENIRAECESSSHGTRFESDIRKATLDLLGWTEELTKKELYGRFKLPSVKEK